MLWAVRLVPTQHLLCQGSNRPSEICSVIFLLQGSSSCSVFQKCELNIDNLSKPELLTLLSIMEGELEARDLVIEALRVSMKSLHLYVLLLQRITVSNNNIVIIEGCHSVCCIGNAGPLPYHYPIPCLSICFTLSFKG